MTAIEALQRSGYKRVGTPKRGFRYQGAPARELKRIHEIRIPPAWTEVAVARSPKARLQAIGKDKKGRWQYRYSSEAVREREQRKFEKLVAFGSALPKLRAAIDRGLSQKGLTRERVMACILRILSTCFMRSGSEVYAKENGSFGIATLQNRHATVVGDVVRFHYRGKSGKDQLRELKDRRVARIVRELKKLPGKDLFQYVAEDGRIVNVTRAMINDAVKEAMGESFNAKDFRTWAGTLIAASTLARLNAEAVPGVTDRKKLLTAAIKETAAQLGNTPAVCKSSYVWHSVPRSFLQGTVVKSYFKTMDELVECKSHGRLACENALLELLKEGKVKPRVAQAVAKAVARRPRSPLSKMSHRMQRNPQARRLAKAFTVH
jgi:DNA topoisomerase-1